MFEQFNVHTDPHTAGVRWDKWIKRLKRLLEALDIIEKAAHSADQKTAINKRRLVLLLHYAGPEIEDIYGTLTGNKDLYSNAKPLFATYFTPKKNVELEIFNFRRSQQEPDENVDAFVTRLRQQAARCNFADDDLEIKLQIIQGCRSNPKSLPQRQPGTGQNVGKRMRRGGSRAVCRKHRAEWTPGIKRPKEFKTQEKASRTPRKQEEIP